MCFHLLEITPPHFNTKVAIDDLHAFEPGHILFQCAMLPDGIVGRLGSVIGDYCRQQRQLSPTFICRRSPVNQGMIDISLTILPEYRFLEDEENDRDPTNTEIHAYNERFISEFDWIASQMMSLLIIFFTDKEYGYEALARLWAQNPNLNAETPEALALRNDLIVKYGFREPNRDQRKKRAAEQDRQSH